MFVLGLQGSPRKKGNTAHLLGEFLKEAESRGARTHTIEVCRRHIDACKELIVCEKKGYCPIKDDMAAEIYGLLRRADVVVAASPVFFYNVTAQLKALIDRCQTLWARKYRLNLKDPGSPMRKGFLLAVGATRGKQLFDGVELTARYFFDALAARYGGGLTYAGIEHSGDMAAHSGLADDIPREVERLLEPFTGRKRVLFVSGQGACRAMMAAAFARFHASDIFDVRCAAAAPAAAMDSRAMAAMTEKGFDVNFLRPLGLADELPEKSADLVVSLDPAADALSIAASRTLAWHLPDPADQDLDMLRSLRDDIEKRIMGLAAEHRRPEFHQETHE